MPDWPGVRSYLDVYPVPMRRPLQEQTTQLFIPKTTKPKSTPPTGLARFTLWTTQRNKLLTVHPVQNTKALGTKRRPKQVLTQHCWDVFCPQRWSCSWSAAQHVPSTQWHLWRYQCNLHDTNHFFFLFVLVETQYVLPPFILQRREINVCVFLFLGGNKNQANETDARFHKHTTNFVWVSKWEKLTVAAAENGK